MFEKISILNPKKLENILMIEKPLIYLAGAFNDLFNGNYKKAYQYHLKVATKLISKGFIVYSPIVLSYPIWKELDNKKFHFWLYFEEKFVKICDCIFFIVNDKLITSEGCKREMEYANKFNKPVLFYIDNVDNNFEIIYFKKRRG